MSKWLPAPQSTAITCLQGSVQSPHMQWGLTSAGAGNRPRSGSVRTSRTCPDTRPSRRSLSDPIWPRQAIVKVRMEAGSLPSLLQGVAIASVVLFELVDSAANMPRGMSPGRSTTSGRSESTRRPVCLR